MEQRSSPVTPEAREAEAIAEHIEAERLRLGEHIRELQAQLGGTIHHTGERIGEVTDRAREAADWHAWVRRRPLLMFGLAFGAGLWLAFRGRR